MPCAQYLWIRLWIHQDPDQDKVFREDDGQHPYLFKSTVCVFHHFCLISLKITTFRSICA